jgi:hypothetical protein
MYLLITLLCIAVAYEAAQALNRAANLTPTSAPTPAPRNKTDSVSCTQD